MGPPDTPGRVIQASPTLFPSLQFSPDWFASQNLGHASVPFFPQQPLFWDPPNTGLDDGGLSQQYQDLFPLSPADLNGSFAPPSTLAPTFTAMGHSHLGQPYDPPSQVLTSNYSPVHGAVFPAPFTTSPRMPPPQSENPNMFLSSPARRFGASEERSASYGRPAVAEKPAYHHQIEQSRREQENKRVQKAEVKHPSISRSVLEALRRPVSPVKEHRPGLKRSLTHTGIRSKQRFRRQSDTDSISTSSLDTSKSYKPGRSSPLKSTFHPTSRTLSSACSINSKRTSLSLAIDEKGVAKTVVTAVQDDAGDMDVDDEASDSEPSSIDESDYHLLRSQNTSFVLPDAQKPTNESPSLINKAYSHSKTSSYSTMASVNSGRQSSMASSATSQNKPRRKHVTLDPTMEDDDRFVNESGRPGDAQRALRAIIQDRSRSTSAQGEAPGVSQPADQFHSSPPVQPNLFTAFNASPTTITDPDLATPSTDRESYVSAGSTRCVCNSSNFDGNVLMIQW